MNYYSNIQLSKKYKISPIQITRWIEKSKEGKNNLQVKYIKQKTSDKEVPKILVNENNERELERLYESGKVKRRYAGKIVKEIDFNSLDIFSTKQIHELIIALKQNYIPFKLSYLSEGAIEWDNFVKNGLESKDYTPTIDTIDQLKELYRLITNLIPSNKKVNIVDVGCGNYLPVAEFVNKIKAQGLLNKYIGVDISKDILDIATKKAKKHLNDNEIVTLIGDVESENFLEVCSSNAGVEVINVILFLGSTLGNHINHNVVIKHLRDSMNEDDILIISNKLNDNAFKVDFKSSLDSPDQFVWLPRLLGFEVEECELYVQYNEVLESKTVELIANSDYQFIFKKDGKIISDIMISKGDKIMLWHHKMTQIGQFIKDLQSAGLNLKSFNCSDYNRGIFITQAKKFKEML